MMRTSKIKHATESFVWRLINDLEERIEERFDETEKEAEKRFNKVMVALDSIAGQ